MTQHHKTQLITLTHTNIDSQLLKRKRSYEYNIIQHQQQTHTWPSSGSTHNKGIRAILLPHKKPTINSNDWATKYEYTSSSKHFFQKLFCHSIDVNFDRTRSMLQPPNAIAMSSIHADEARTITEFHEAIKPNREHHALINQLMSTWNFYRCDYSF